MSTKTPSYRITTSDDSLVDARTERPAAIKRADKLTAETGLVHRVYTPGGKLVHETEVIEAAPADDVPSVDIAEEVAEEVAEVIEDEAAPVEVHEMTIIEDEDEDDAPVEVHEMTIVDTEDDAEEVAEPAAEEAAEEVAEPVTEEAAEDVEDAAEEARDFVSYAILMDQLKDNDEAVRAAAKAEWKRRLETYREAARKIVGPAMAAALERGETTDGRTRTALIKRGLVEAGDGMTFTVNDAGREALAAAVEAVL